MKTLTGPGLFLAQFAQDTPPHNSLEAIARWAKNYGYKGIQIPSWDKRFFDLDKAAESNAYCDEVKGKLFRDIGIQITELSTHFRGQMVSASRSMTRCVRRAGRGPNTAAIGKRRIGPPLG
jgi:sugar phosphate isomerase/epimerase